MNFKHLNSDRNVLLESFHSLLEDIFRGSELEPIPTGIEEYKQVIERVIEDPEGASEEDIVYAIKYYKRLKMFLNDVGPKLADAKKVLDTVKAYKSGDRSEFTNKLKSDN
jgi:hypothetical protein